MDLGSTAPAPAAYPFEVPAAFSTWDTDTLTPRFQLLRKVGRGAYGEVALALDHSTTPPRQVAIKRVFRVFGYGVALEHSRRILREVRILRSLRHDNVVSLLHVCAPRHAEYTELYLVFEKLDSDLKDLFSREDASLSLYHVRGRARGPGLPRCAPP